MLGFSIANPLRMPLGSEEGLREGTIDGFARGLALGTSLRTALGDTDVRFDGTVEGRPDCTSLCNPVGLSL